LRKTENVPLQLTALAAIANPQTLQIDFHVPSTNMRVSNIISQSHNGGPDDMYLTFTFEWHNPEVDAGSEEARKLEEKYTGAASSVVPHTVEVARKMKVEGRL
jgi:hypothetical protein